MQIFLRSLDGRTQVFDVGSGDVDVAAVKRAVEERDGPPADEVRLTFAGRELDDEATLDECGVTRDATLAILLRLRGGMPKKGGKKGKKGKKGPKDLTPDRTMDWLIKELVDKNILQLPEHVKVDHYVGHYKIIDGIDQKSNDPVPPTASLAQVRQTVVEQLILPLGSLPVHQKAPYVNKALLYGPAGTGPAKKKCSLPSCSPLPPPPASCLVSLVRAHARMRASRCAEADERWRGGEVGGGGHISRWRRVKREVAEDGHVYTHTTCDASGWLA